MSRVQLFGAEDHMGGLSRTPADLTPNPDDPFSLHEALHMASRLAQIVEDELLEHPSVKDRPLWAGKAEAACYALLELYQMIGEHHLSRHAGRTFPPDPDHPKPPEPDQ